MIATGRAVVLTGLLLALLGAGGCTGQPQRPDPCAAEVAAVAQEVHTERRWTEQELPGVGDYLSIHWQGRPLGNPCSRVPGPTDWAYQGVLALRPADVRALAEGYDWQPVDPAEDPMSTTPMWPALAQFAPASARWLHSPTYRQAHAGGGQVHT